MCLLGLFCQVPFWKYVDLLIPSLVHGDNNLLSIFTNDSLRRATARSLQAGEWQLLTYTRSFSDMKMFGSGVDSTMQ